MSIWLPEIEHIMLFHSKITGATGGSDGVRERGLIESALGRASASFGGVDAYPDVVSKAVAAGCGLAQNHGFIDGNKRIGVATMLLILRRNGVQLCYTQEELTQLGLAIAQDAMDVTDVLAWVREHMPAGE